MADFYGNCRSNYVRVTGEKKFRKICKKYGVECVEQVIKRGDLAKKVGFLVTTADKGTLPSGYDVGEEFIDNDIMMEISKILMDGEVFIVQEVGAEKLRYLGGWAIAINNKQEYVRVTIEDIYKLAQGIIPEHMYIGKPIDDRKPIGTQITEVAY